MTRVIHHKPDPLRSPHAAHPRLAGVVTYHNSKGGYGKIHANETELEYFFHATACRRADGANTFHTLEEGTAVTFLAGETDKGPRAFEVQLDQDAKAGTHDAADTRGNR